MSPGNERRIIREVVNDAELLYVREYSSASASGQFSATSAA